MNFDDKTDTRVREEEIIQINNIIKKNPTKYKNRSHFTRVAIIKLIRKEGEENNANAKKTPIQNNQKKREILRQHG